MNLIGQSIEHRAFGPGIITDLAEDVVTVCFRQQQKKFIYPDAFRDFLTTKDPDTQWYIDQQLKARAATARDEKRTAQEVRDQKRKLLHFKVTANSHAVFDVAPAQLEQTVQRCQVFTGTYLSGASKGLARPADRLKPNSVCLLTTRPSGQPEEERSIVGAYMVKEDFFGEESRDGRIEGHPQHRMVLPEESELFFWDYFGRKAPRRWGSMTFKYCTADVANQILADMTELLCDSLQEDSAGDFYRYFCKRNQLRPLLAPKEEEA